jgi:hypothetical protein
MGTVINKEYIMKEIERMFSKYSPDRGIRITTGAGGMDLFSEAMEYQLGLKRIYMSKRPPRFMKSKAKQSASGRYYILIKSVL